MVWVTVVKDGKRTCIRCRLEKPVSEFSPAAKGSKYTRSECKKCSTELHAEYLRRLSPEKRRSIRARYSDKIKLSRRAYNLKTNFGLTPEKFVEMLAAQGGACAICKTGDPGSKGTFHVDHSHETGIVRGLLCSRCNLSLGLFKDDPLLLSRAIEYLLAAKDRR